MPLPAQNGRLPRRLPRRLPHPGTLLSAILIVLSFPPWGLSPLILFSLVPWFHAVDQAPSALRAAREGLWLSILMSLGGFFWVSHVLAEFSGLHWSFGLIGLAGYCLIGQPQFTVFAPALWLIRRRVWNHPAWLGICLALLYTGMESFIPKLFVDTLGHCFFNAPRIRQVADLGGAALLTCLVFWTNDLIYRAAQRLRHRREPSLWPSARTIFPSACAGIAAWLLVFGYGQVRLSQVQRRIAETQTTVVASVIQGNIGDFDKLASERGVVGASDRVLDTYFRLSDEALARDPDTDFLVWPETSYPSTFRTPITVAEMNRDRRVEHYVREHRVPLLFGGYDRSKGKDYNALFILSPLHGVERALPGAPIFGSSDLQVYRKNILLLFGEYIPLAERILWLKTMFPQVGNFGRGVGPVALPVRLRSGGEVKVAPVICYEALFADYTIPSARRGAQIILNVTNDSWFGEFGEPELHLALVTFRSIETRLPQIRATNTGISTLILPTGEIQAPSPMGRAMSVAMRVPILTTPMNTLVKAWGDWFGCFALFAGCALLLLLFRKTAA